MVSPLKKTGAPGKLPSQILSPTLVIMLGSTPARAGLELCRHMLTLSREDRSRVALVHIDTDEEPSELTAFHKEHEGVFRTFRLHIAVPVGINHASLPTEPLHTFIPSKRPQYYANGAGGIRNNGHVAAAFDYQKIIQTLESAIQHLELLGNAQGERRVESVEVEIVAFLGGGTGSGILADVTVMVRQLLLERQYQQRINLFCMLPDWIQGTSNNDINWRKSNAAACLLELVALSLVADKKPNRIYQKFLLNKVYVVTPDPIASEIYLIGRTSMGSSDDTARIVGLDLFQRIANASGVGKLEHSTWMNRRALGATDDRGLPTMFATSCPLEVRFPVRESATAFARVAASYLLPFLAGIKAPRPDVDTTRRMEWTNTWNEVAELRDDTKGNPLGVRNPDDFEVSAFEDTTTESLEEMWSELRRRQNITTTQIRDKILQKRQEEMDRINHVQGAPASAQQSPLTVRVEHLQLLEEEYTMVLNAIQQDLLDEEPERPQPRRSFLYFVPFLGNWLKHRHSEDLCNEYNTILKERVEMVRNSLLRENLRELLAQVQTRLQEAMRWIQFKDTNLNEQCDELLTAGTTSPAWQGKLDRPHPHQRHLFDLTTLHDTRNGGNSATESLFMRLTFPVLEQNTPNTGNTALRFDSQVLKKNIMQFSERCLYYLNTGKMDAGAAGPASADIESQNKERFADRVVDFFYRYYLDRLQAMNLFQLLRTASGQHRNVVTGSYQMAGEYLLEHLLHIRGLVRDLIAFQETLWDEGPGRLDTSLFVSLNADDGDQRHELNQIISKLGPLTNRNQTPQVEITNDPHRLQVAYGQHGISLATIPEFYSDSNSAMSEYIRYQGDWYGNGPNRFLPNPLPQAYGSNKMPVHSSGEMERLVCDPDALGYLPTQPHAREYKTNLIGRVIRQAPSLPDQPNWGP